jgi:hypothetical protein
MAAAFAQRGERIKELESQLAALPKALASIPEVGCRQVLCPLPLQGRRCGASLPMARAGARVAGA